PIAAADNMMVAVLDEALTLIRAMRACSADVSPVVDIQSTTSLSAGCCDCFHDSGEIGDLAILTVSLQRAATGRRPELSPHIFACREGDEATGQLARVPGLEQLAGGGGSPGSPPALQPRDDDGQLGRWHLCRRHREGGPAARRDCADVRRAETLCDVAAVSAERDVVLGACSDVDVAELLLLPWLISEDQKMQPRELVALRQPDKRLDEDVHALARL